MALEQDLGSDVQLEAAGPGDPQVNIFGFAPWDRPVAFDFVGRLRKLEFLLGRRFHKLHLRDPDRAWYLHGVARLGEDLPSAWTAPRQVIATRMPARVITLGQSMGGYGAILYGHALSAER